MLITVKTLMFVAMFLFSVAAFQEDTVASGSSPEYTSDSQLKFPEHYREWVYLTSGFDMSYFPAAQSGEHHMFDNVFVNPESYKAFVKTGPGPTRPRL